jgi:K+-transporting ATPase ATPase B chain
MTNLFSKKILLHAFGASLKKLNPFELLHNPVIFITQIGALITTFEWLFLIHGPSPFYAQISIWLWLTVLFANFAESVARG